MVILGHSPLPLKKKLGTGNGRKNHLSLHSNFPQKLKIFVNGNVAFIVDEVK